MQTLQPPEVHAPAVALAVSQGTAERMPSGGCVTLLCESLRGRGKLVELAISNASLAFQSAFRAQQGRGAASLSADSIRHVRRWRALAEHRSEEASAPGCVLQ